MQKPLLVRADWDEEAAVWVAESDDIPGLVTEAETVEELVAKLKQMIPELLELNAVAGHGEIVFEILIRRFEMAQHKAA